MHKVIKMVNILLLLCNILLINSCNCSNLPAITYQKQNTNPTEIILFIGNSGVGKSSLCNSVFQQAIFKPGIPAATGMIAQKQEYRYGNTLYIDAPGLADVKNHQQAAVEIENALKYNNNYKIVFVMTLESGRVRPDDVTTIETVCEAIKVSFEYGIIFNKVTKPAIEDIAKKGVDVYLNIFKKKPYSAVVLKRDEDIEDRADVYFQRDSKNRESLLSFLINLKASRIEEKDVQKLDIRNFYY
jgi:GTP-binding protein EngB required for normal cell division